MGRPDKDCVGGDSFGTPGYLMGSETGKGGCGGDVGESPGAPGRFMDTETGKDGGESFSAPGRFLGTEMDIVACVSGSVSSLICSGGGGGGGEDAGGGGGVRGSRDEDLLRGVSGYGSVDGLGEEGR
jgi:hypothetical protein